MEPSQCVHEAMRRGKGGGLEVQKELDELDLEDDAQLAWRAAHPPLSHDPANARRVVLRDGPPLLPYLPASELKRSYKQ